MSDPKPPQPVKLFISILTHKNTNTGVVCRSLENRFGTAESITDPVAFHFTDYYKQELGTPLIRVILSFTQLIEPDELPDIKLTTNALEKEYLRKNGMRTFNIDPGYIALGHIILATGKPFAHRPYLQKGIYADMTLIFKGKTFRPLPWSFPDYASEGMVRLLNGIRQRYYRQLHEGHLL